MIPAIMTFSTMTKHNNTQLNLANNTQHNSICHYDIQPNDTQPNSKNMAFWVLPMFGKLANRPSVVLLRPVL